MSGRAAALETYRVEPIAWRADHAAAALDISTTTFLSLVAEGRMPKPIRLRDRIPLYDVESVRNAWRALKDAQADDERNPWD